MTDPSNLQSRPRFGFMVAWSLFCFTEEKKKENQPEKFQPPWFISFNKLSRKLKGLLWNQVLVCLWCSDRACVHVLGCSVKEPWALVLYLLTCFPGTVKSAEQLWLPRSKHVAEGLKGLTSHRPLALWGIIVMNESWKEDTNTKMASAVVEAALRNLRACSAVIA